MRPRRIIPTSIHAPNTNNMIFTAGVVVVAAVVGTSAQAMGNVSQACQNAAASALTGPAGTCLGISGLLNVFSTPANTSLISPINSWLTSTCAQPPCTNDTLDAAITNITTGCKSDLSVYDITSGTVEDIKDYVEEWYATGREVACLKDSSASDAFCITTTLQNIENYIGVPLSIGSIGSITTRLAATGGEIPKNLTCTNCVQAAYALIRPKLNDSNRGTWDSYLSGQCGSSFTNGTSPESIKQSANSGKPGSSGSGNGAISSSKGVFGIVGTALLGVAGAAALAL